MMNLQGPAAGNAKVNRGPKGSNTGRVSIAQLEGDEFGFVGVNPEAISHQPVCDHVKTICAFLEHRVVVGTSGDNGTIVHICGEQSELLGFCDMQEWEDVHSREDRGQRGPLRGAVVQNNFGEGLAIEHQSDASICEEQADPVAEQWCKA